jgi:hypothetical protein
MWQRRDQLNRVEFPTRNAFHFMNEIIQASLRQIQEQQGFKIIYACESGSRAWGFSSTDSDYDVRFLYVNPADWYLSVDVEDKPDVFERPITDELDVSGWDLRKALMLLRKSNPPLLEWLNSPIIYLEMIEVVERLRELIPEFYSPIAWHITISTWPRGTTVTMLEEVLFGERSTFTSCGLCWRSAGSSKRRRPCPWSLANWLTG